MAVVVTNNLTTVDGADATTGWTSSGGGFSTYSGFEREATACLGDQASEGYVEGYFGISSTDLSDVTVFGPWMRSGNPHTEASNGFGISLGDGTDRRAYAVGGSDNYGHFVLGWSMFKLDTTVLPATYRQTLGSAAPSFAAITQIGGEIGYQTKAVGSSDNIFFDILRYIANGSPALTVAGGTSGDKGTFANIITEDIKVTDGFAYGIFRDLVPGAKAYEMNYGCDFGDSGTADSYFNDSDFQLFIIGSDMKAGNMDFTLLANSTGTNEFVLDNFVVVSVGTASNWDLSDANSNTMEITNGQFVDLGTISFPVTGGTSRKCENTTFVNCGQVDPSTMTITSLTFQGTTDANGALLGNRNMDGHTFVSDGTGHAIYITSTGTYDYTSNTFTGYGADGTTDAVIYNNSGGSVTINVNSGDTPTFRNGSGASTTIVAGAVTVKVTAIEADGTAIASARAHLRASDGTGPFPYQESVTITRSGTTATVAHTAHGMDTNDKVLLGGITDKTEDNGVQQITKIDADSYSYTTTDSGSTSYTGTIVSTFVALDGLTDVNGEISVSRVYSADQPVTGWTRKSTTSPYFKEGILTGSILSASGYDKSAVMVSDE